MRYYCPHCSKPLEIVLEAREERPTISAETDEIRELPFPPSRRCPICFTYGHTHRKDCPNRDDGMSKHVPFEYKGS